MLVLGADTSRHSVVTGSVVVLRTAALSACHGARLAHFTRVGYSRNARERRELVEVLRRLSTAPVSKAVTLSNSSSESLTVCPLTRSVINEEDATEIAQPVPLKRHVLDAPVGDVDVER
jgi:hypothetical protein